MEEKEDKKMTLTKIDLKKASTAQIEKYIFELDDFNQRMEIFFDNERNKLNVEIQALFTELGKKDFHNFVVLQAESLAVRQTVVNIIAVYMQKLSKATSNFNISNSDRIEYYATGYGIKVSDGTRTKLIDKDLSERERNIKLFQTHIGFLRECLKSIDQIGYAIKNVTIVRDITT